MVNNMNRYGVLNRIRCVEHAPVTNAELEQAREWACQRLPLDFMEMLGEPLDLFGYASGDCGMAMHGFPEVLITLNMKQKRQ